MSCSWSIYLSEYMISQISCMPRLNWMVSCMIFTLVSSIWRHCESPLELWCALHHAMEVWVLFDLNCTLCSTGCFSSQPTVFFSHTKLAPATSQPAVIFSHNKLAQAAASRIEFTPLVREEPKQNWKYTFHFYILKLLVHYLTSVNLVKSTT